MYGEFMITTFTVRTAEMHYIKQKHKAHHNIDEEARTRKDSILVSADGSERGFRQITASIMNLDNVIYRE